MHEFPFSRLLALVLVVASAVPAFQDWQGFRFGKADTVYSRDIPWAVGRLPDGRLVVGGQSDDSTCCRFDSVGAFGGSNLGTDYIPFLAYPNSVGNEWDPDFQWGYRSQLRARWFDLQAIGTGGFLTVGTIADTVLFTGTRKVWHGGQAPDSMDGHNQEAVLAAGGGGGIGVGIWSDSGMRLRLLRFGSGVGWPIGWQVLPDSSGFTITGNFETRVDGWVHEGADSFAYSATEGSCFAFHQDLSSHASWWSSAPCALKTHSEIQRTRYGLWMTFNESITGGLDDSSGLSWFRGVRPGLARLDPATGEFRNRLHPLGEMQGMVRALASDEHGNLLLQGEQSSAFEGNASILAPVVDTVFPHGSHAGLFSITAGWLALLDSTGVLRTFRQLNDLENVGGWKLRRAPGIGWVALTWDEKDVVGWSKLYLFDDFLRLVDTSPRLPPAADLELGPDGEILLSGYGRNTNLAAPWLRGTGSMWVASCRLGTETARAWAAGRPAGLRLQVQGHTVEVSAETGALIRVRGTDVQGRVWLDRTVESGTRLVMPQGISVLVAGQDGNVLSRRVMVP